jgi:hypothetical protein
MTKTAPPSPPPASNVASPLEPGNDLEEMLDDMLGEDANIQGSNIEEILSLFIDVALHHLVELSASHGDSRRVWAKRLIGLRDRAFDPISRFLKTSQTKLDAETLRVLAQITLSHLKETTERSEKSLGLSLSTSQIAEILLFLWDFAEENLARLVLQSST